ncbi:DUF4429 domain-containing protein [Allonocardiopsis opalescens]|uniref:Uncharacterized protein DUF4429 n=1 Tax=Allonocardiopsis opalescens TaxID=1144618 RepID=A0A2T0PSE2_9ACTN|nr:DUF4429 domain-containing protein [Allonocardiopsis opalescens]PRX91823.1 uncharacterized protein DUF4429 [Allonocardiopsis opalescens]
MDELRGDQAVWRFDGESIAIHYHTGAFKDPLLKKLGRCEVPVAAVASADFLVGGGRGKGWSLTLRLRERTDPFAAAGAMLAKRSQPFRLTGPAKTELLAEYHADQIGFAAGQAADIGPGAPPAVATRLVPPLPLHIQTSEGAAAFDGTAVRLVWSGSDASARKRKRQRAEFPLADIANVEWVPSDGWEYGYLRVVARGEAAEAPTKPKHDFSCLLCDEGEEGAAALLMAATVTAHLWAAEAEPRPEIEAAAPAEPAAITAAPAGQDNEWVYQQIERLGRLHAQGILTDEEFSAKKAELLARI